MNAYVCPLPWSFPRRWGEGTLFPLHSGERIKVRGRLWFFLLYYPQFLIDSFLLLAEVIIHQSNFVEDDNILDEQGFQRVRG
jgi:hypothetical protein